MRPELASTVLVMLCAAALGTPGQVEGGDVIPLPEPQRTGEVSVEEALEARRSVRSYASVPLELETIGQLSWAAQGITRPGPDYRTAPSAGATFPIEIDLLIHGLDDEVETGVYRYLPGEHALRKRFAGDHRNALRWAALRQRPVVDAPVVMVISGVTARTEDRYRGRAERYVYMEAGHVAQNVYLQGVPLGVGTVVIGAFWDTQVSRVLRLEDGEAPLYILPLGKMD